MKKTARAIKREETYEQIKSAAQKLIAEEGTSGLALRKIAREIGLVPSAIYRYYDSLDDIITALIVEAFQGLAGALAAARDANRTAPPTVQLMAVMVAYRQWALDHVTQFQLIYGTPIPGYEAPREITVPVASGSLQVIVEVLVDAIEQGACVPPPNYAHISDAQRAYFTGMLQAAEVVQDAPITESLLQAVYLSTHGWPRIHGLIHLEINGHIGPVAGDMDAHYLDHMRKMFCEMGMTPP